MSYSEEAKRGYSTLSITAPCRMRQERAKALGLSDIQIYTTHAFAYLYLQRNGYIRNRNIDNLRTAQVKEYLNTNYRTAFWILEVFKRFLYSPYPLNVVKPFVINLFEHSAFIQSVFEELGLSLFEVAYYLLRLTEGIEKGSLPMPHDYYLKYFTFQIAPSLSYDLVILDEAQDANPATVEKLFGVKEEKGKRRKVKLEEVLQAISEETQEEEVDLLLYEIKVGRPQGSKDTVQRISFTLDEPLPLHKEFKIEDYIEALKRLNLYSFEELKSWLIKIEDHIERVRFFMAWLEWTGRTG